MVISETKILAESKIVDNFESELLLNDEYVLNCKISMNVEECNKYLSLFFRLNKPNIKVKPYFMKMRNKITKEIKENENSTIIIDGVCHSDGKRYKYNINLSNNETKIESSEICKCSIKNMKSEESECINNKREIKYIWKEPRLCNKDEEIYETDIINCCIYIFNDIIVLK